VVGVSRSAPSFDPSDLPAPICDTCGFPIVEADQECPARDEGVCGA
jgi:hypothetical protein